MAPARRPNIIWADMENDEIGRTDRGRSTRHCWRGLLRPLLLGGHLWHRQFFWLLLALPMIGVVAVPPTVLRWWPRRLAFIAAVLGLFVVTRGVASAFYPTASSSWRELRKRSWSASSMDRVEGSRWPRFAPPNQPLQA